MSEDAHNPDGSPPSFVPAEVRAQYWEKRARFAEDQRETLLRELTNMRQVDGAFLNIIEKVALALLRKSPYDLAQAQQSIDEALELLRRPA